MNWINMDYHLHTDLSDGHCDLDEVLALEYKRGIRKVIITDHYDPIAFNHLKISFDNYFEKINKVRKKWLDYGLKVGVGLETMAVDGQLPLKPEILNRSNLIISSIHRVKIDKRVNNWLDSDYWKKYKKDVLATIETKGVDVIGHIEGYMPFPKGTMPEDILYLEVLNKVAEIFFDIDWYQQVANKALENKVAVEIHCPTRTPRIEMLRFLKQQGVKFTIGSDGHNREDFGGIEYAREVIEELNFSKEDFLIVI